jgi:hypothetical protein
MRLQLLVATFALTLTGFMAQAGEVSTSKKWWTYIADYDGKPGSIRLDMALREEAPLPNLPELLVFGVRYEVQPESGLPTEKALDGLNRGSDALISAVLTAQPGLYVGTFTHDGEQLHYVYVRSSAGAEDAFKRTLTTLCPTCVASFKTRSDPQWNAYLRFLYPNQATLDHYGVNPATFVRR